MGLRDPSLEEYHVISRYLVGKAYQLALAPLLILTTQILITKLKKSHMKLNQMLHLLPKLFHKHPLLPMNLKLKLKN